MTAGVATFCSWSGGKDSALALHHAVLAGAEPRLLVTMLTEGGERSRSHGLRRTLLERQAAAVGVPIRFAATTWDSYERVFTETIDAAVGEGVTNGVFGDIDPGPRPCWADAVADRTGATTWLPLWRRPRRALMDELLGAGFRVVIVAVREGRLPKSLLGDVLDTDLVERVARYGADLAGEDGGYHTLVIDGPIFAEPLPVSFGDIVLRDGVWFIDVSE